MTYPSSLTYGKRVKHLSEYIQMTLLVLSFLMATEVIAIVVLLD